MTQSASASAKLAPGASAKLAPTAPVKLVPVAPKLASIPQAAAQAHLALLKHKDLQFDFPGFVEPKPPDWAVWLGKLLSHLAFLGPFMTYILWGIFLAGAALILYFVVREILRRGWFSSRGPRESVRQMEPWRPAPEKARLLLADADALAAAGRYAEAIHLILLRSIADIGERRPELLKPALTSREIGALPGLPEAAREAFVSIARVVERAIFAGREVGAEDYAQCRAEYERFAFPEGWTRHAR